MTSRVNRLRPLNGSSDIRRSQLGSFTRISCVLALDTYTKTFDEENRTGGAITGNRRLQVSNEGVGPVS